MRRILFIISLCIASLSFAQDGGSVDDLHEELDEKHEEIDNSAELTAEQLGEIKDYVKYLEELLAENQLNYDGSIFGADSAVQEELKTKLVDLKEKIEQREEEKRLAEQKNMYLTWSIIFLILFCIPTILAIVFYLNNKKTKKLNAILDDQNTKLTQAHDKIMSSIKYAERIQKSVLVKPEVINDHFKESFVLWKPKDIVSGDFYYFTSVGNQLIITAVDCTGHGVPGAFMTIMGNSFLNEIINEQGITKPAEILTHLHEKIQESLSKGDSQSNDGMDIAMACIDMDKKKISFAGANNPLFYVSDNELQIVPATRGGIGGTKVYQDMNFEHNEIDISAVDVFYLFSDGFHDQFGGAENRKFMKKRFKQLLLDNHGKSMEQQKKILDDEIVSWQGVHEQTDDILVIGVKL